MKINEDGIDRNLTDEEIAQHLSFVARIESEQKLELKAAKDRQLLKEATLAKLGLTADEVAALLS